MEKVVRTKLSFKGTGAVKSVIRRPVENSSSEEHLSNQPEKVTATIKVEKGTGRLTCSGTTVHGHESKFMDELSAGDAVIVVHPTSLREETKIVKMVLSNISMSVSSAFSSDIISTTLFQYIKAPKDLAMSAEEQAARATKRKHEEEVAAFGTYASKGGEEFVYRVKKPGAFGGYAVVKETLGSSDSKTREDLLNMRSKKKADRFCY